MASAPPRKPKKVAPTTTATSTRPPRAISEHSGLSGQQKRALQDEITAANARITFLKSMGCRVNPKTGGLFLQERVSVHQTGAGVHLTYGERCFYLKIDTREHNTYIKDLGGRWRAVNSSWLFPNARLEDVKASFNVECEDTLPPREDVELTFTMAEGEDDEILVTGSRAPGPEYTRRFREMGGRFDGKARTWHIPSAKTAEVQELVGDLLAGEEE
jgi:hypothetical protein